jgi:hypothetical protein
MPNLNLDFSTYVTPRQGTRAPLAGFIQSKLRGVLELSEDANGSKPEEAFYPYRYLPIWMLDTTLDDGVVIPKGSIVSVLSTKTTQAAAGFDEISDATGIFIGVDYTGGPVQANIDTNYFGYTDAVAGLLIPANGGVDASGGCTALDQYTTLDNDKTINPVSQAYVSIAAGGSNVSVSYTRSANLPVGVVTGDVYQDIRGAHLNYQVWNIWGIKMRGYVEIPFVDLWSADTNGDAKDDTLSGYLDSAGVANTILPDAPWYAAVARKHAYLYNPVDSANLLVPGCLLKSDLYGKFVPEYVVPANMVTGGYQYGREGWNFAKALGTVTYDAPVTAQTVGRLVVTDSRFPKDMLETVSTYPGSLMPGTDTAGLPAPLYTFTYDVMKESGDTRFTNGPTLVQMLDRVQMGIFGVARIQLVLA